MYRRQAKIVCYCVFRLCRQEDAKQVSLLRQQVALMREQVDNDRKKQCEFGKMLQIGEDRFANAFVSEKLPAADAAQTISRQKKAANRKPAMLKSTNGIDSNSSESSLGNSLLNVHLENVNKVGFSSD